MPVADNVQIVLRAPASPLRRLLGLPGRIKSKQTSHNLIVTKGAEGIADQLLASPTISKPSHMAVGKKTSPTAPAAGDTTLQEEADRNALTEKTRSGKVVTLKCKWEAGDATATLTEAGIFDASSSGNMYSRVTYGAVVKEAADTLEIIWTYTVG